MAERRDDNVPSTDERIERLGKRLGRGLSILLAAALILYLWHRYFTH